MKIDLLKKICFLNNLYDFRLELEQYMRKENVDILNEIMVSVLDLEDDINISELKQADLASWDSLAIVNLVVAVESDLEVKINNDEFESFTSYKEIVSILNNKGL